MSKQEIENLFNKWNDAIQTTNPKEVVALYDKSAILLPTLSNKIRRNHEEIESYFVDFLKKKPVATINESHVQDCHDVVIHSGIYTFDLEGSIQAKARFSYVYQLKNNTWLIIGHHSSLLPESN